ncbi:MAG TPA: methyltransferase [Bryobacteraceae bacterium]|nr:methyltransferase [Bryobacteraceae bacterium]
MYPIRLGTDAEFAALREALIACDYTETAICSRFGVKSVSDLRVEDAAAEADASDPVRILTRLLIGCAEVPLVDALPVGPMEALGVVRVETGKMVSTVMLYPIRGLYIVSDRAQPTFDDIVYPANIPNTEMFLDYAPIGPCDEYLDLCAGSGVAALEAARKCARHAWAFDITARSTHFAEFNRRLNAIPNMTAAQGDLYDPAEGRTFDRIVAHPPYLPVFRPRFVFDSGGQDGEQIVRRIVEGLPKHLRPGGVLFALTMGSDREQPFERRVRDWLGESSDDFDVAFIVKATASPHDYAADAVIKHRGSVEDIEAWRELFISWGVHTLPYGLVYIQRRATDRPVFTVRRTAGPGTGAAECGWLMAWAAAAYNAQKILVTKPRARGGITLRTEHRFVDGQWSAESCLLETDYPFLASMQTESLTALLLTLADGSLTTVELLKELQLRDALPASIEPLDFARVVAALITSGFLESGEYKLPTSSSSASGPESTR